MSGRTRFGGMLLAGLLLAGCGGGEGGETVRVTIPEGSGMAAVADSLGSRGVIRWPAGFRLYARLRGAERSVKPGVYELRQGSSWGTALDRVVSGDVVQVRVAVPEGWTARQIAARVAEVTGAPADSVLAIVADTALPKELGVPGPTLEGYLYPATYSFPAGTPPRRMVRAMVDRYRRAWTPEMRARADSLGMSEREVVTLASIVEKEAKVWTERDTISAVYHNRLRIGMRLQADPTVQYALGAHQSRLLYSHIDDVADNPYNTYRHAGLPPGPIASPSRGAIEAALNPAAVDYLYFVARPNGTHVFTRSLAQHNAAKRASQRERAAGGR
ncbi:MAG TPA: endolytic transglycosylase MltG [Longimicrobiaceae bacterium]|nr:endolytic transglycosylase MltG [Longimicrobiaceae bacterium]